jgi:hypothetical protein
LNALRYGSVSPAFGTSASENITEQTAKVRLARTDRPVSVHVGDVAAVNVSRLGVPA